MKLAIIRNPLQKIAALVLIFIPLIYVPVLAVSNQSDQPSGQIAYVKSSVKNAQVQTDICILTTETLDEDCVTHTSNYSEYSPTWSPDGQILAYGASELPLGEAASITYLYDVAHQTFQTLPQNWYITGWSPDSRQVVTTAFQKRFSYGDIIVVDLKNNHTEQLTDTEDPELNAAWSPDGKQLVYMAGNPIETLMSMSVHGENIHALTSDLNVSGTPEWSPDGKQIAFVVNGEFIGQDQTSEIYVVNADGSNLHQLTKTGGVTLDPKWSPDGKQVVFSGYTAGAFDIKSTSRLLSEVFRINADGSDLTDLTNNTGLDAQPAWSSDGKWIAFASTRKWEGKVGVSGIFVMRSDGTDVQMLTNEPPLMEGGSGFTNPVWRPEVTRGKAGG
jgi:Tol biopolymer transport system component